MGSDYLTELELERLESTCKAASLLWPEGSSSTTPDDSAARERFRLYVQGELPRLLAELRERRSADRMEPDAALGKVNAYRPRRER